MYKLMLSDLDETLLQSITYQNLMLKQSKLLVKKRLKFVPATGRAYMIPEIL